MKSLLAELLKEAASVDPLREFIASQKELPPEFGKIIDDNWEDLLLDDKPKEAASDG